jgi:hypothetical protein
LLTKRNASWWQGLLHREPSHQEVFLFVRKKRIKYSCHPNCNKALWGGQSGPLVLNADNASLRAQTQISRGHDYVVNSPTQQAMSSCLGRCSRPACPSDYTDFTNYRHHNISAHQIPQLLLYFFCNSLNIFTKERK